MHKVIRTATALMVVLALNACHRQSDFTQGYIEGYFTYLSSNTDGFLQQLNVYRGEWVKPGQVTFILEAQPQAAQLAEAFEKLKQAQADLKNLQKGQRPTVLQGIEQQIQQAQAELDLAQKTFERNRQLVATGAISKQDFDRAQSDFNSANAKFKQQIANLNEAKLGSRVDVIAAGEAAVRAALAEMNSAQWYLVKKTVTAPAEGSINDTYYRLGEFVPAGKPVLSMLIPTDVRLIFYVPEALLGKISIGKEVQVSCDHCAQIYPAKISFISSQAEYTPPVIYSETERKKLVYRVEAKFSDADAKLMHPGQPVDVKINNDGSRG